MADRSPIEWTDATWNPVTGCSVVSPGCTNCYAMKLAGGRLRDHPSRQGLTSPSKAGPVWNGQVRLNTEWLDQPLRWTKPRRIFVCAHGDLFHESVPDAWIDQVFAVMALSPRHTFQVLTKRAARMRAWFEERWQGTTAQHLEFADGVSLDIPAGGPTGRRDQVEQACEPFLREHGLADPSKDRLWTDEGSCKAMGWKWPLPNVWLGVSAEDQPRADERVPELLATPAAVRFVSYEPALGPVDFRPWLSDDDGCERCDDGEGLGRNRCSYRDIPRSEQCPRNFAVFEYPEGPPDGEGVPTWMAERRVTLDWIICGGESGPDARPMHPDWARQVRDDCAAAGVPFFFKQWGEWAPGECAGPIRGAQTAGDWWDGAWTISTYSQGEAEDFTSDTEPDVWRVGKKAAGRRLDGVIHDAMPKGVA